MSEEEDRNLSSEVFMKKLMASATGAAIFLKKRGDKNAPNFTFGKHFNPELTTDSTYFKNLEDLMKCVERNADKNLSEQD